MVGICNMDKVTTGKIMADICLTDKVMTDKIVADICPTDKVMTDKIIADIWPFFCNSISSQPINLEYHFVPAYLFVILRVYLIGPP